MGIFKKKDDSGKITIKLNYRAMEHVEKGMDLAQMGRIREAEQEFKEAIKIEPATADAYFGLAMIKQQSGLLDEAHDLYKTALRHDPIHTDSMFNIGAIYVMKKDFESAISTFVLLTRLTPDDPQVFLNLGSAYQQSGRYKESIVPLEHALTLDPNYNNAKILLNQAKTKAG